MGNLRPFGEGDQVLLDLLGSRDHAAEELLQSLVDVYFLFGHLEVGG